MAAAVVGFIDGMNDPRLKPRLLRSLLRDRIPDEQHSTADPSELASALSAIEVHELLSERGSSDPKLAEAWRAAMDAWVERLLVLVSSNMFANSDTSLNSLTGQYLRWPAKCWAGVCLLGVTCKDCSSNRFQASYSVWFQKLLSNIQLPATRSPFVKAASCASLSDLLTRLAVFPNVKKDATGLAGKAILPILHLLDDNPSESILEGAVDLLCTIITFFPTSIRQNYSNVEAILVSKIFSGKCNANISKKVACTIALLPKVKGDEGSWSSMMQRILIEINMFVSDAFQGLEKEENCSEIMKLIVPTGKDPPPPLGGESRSRQAPDRTMMAFRDLLVPSVSALMHCCSLMLTNHFPVQVTVPVRPLLALIGRILRMDGSLHQQLFSTTSLHQELVCSAMNDLHLCSLDLLVAVIKGMRSQLLPHAANVVRLLTENFRKATFPSIRIKFYYILQILLISMGVGMALYLAQEVIDNAFIDLNDHTVTDCVSQKSFSLKVEKETSVRKRKHSFGPSVEKMNGGFVEADAISEKSRMPISVKVASLKALEALLTVGGFLKSECWRSKVDALVVNVATYACDIGWTHEGDSSILSEESTSSAKDFQLAALQALLASLLSPSHGRPSYLSQGLELFRRGKQQTGTELAAFCSRALLALEVLIHPRMLPLIDSSVSRSSIFNERSRSMYPVHTFCSGDKSKTTPPSMGGPGASVDLDYDKLYNSWLGNDDETIVGGGNLDEATEYNKRQLEGSMKDSQAEDEVATQSYEPRERDREMFPVAVDAVMKDGDGVELEKPEKPKPGIVFDSSAEKIWPNDGGEAPSIVAPVDEEMVPRVGEDTTPTDDAPDPRLISRDDGGSSYAWKLEMAANFISDVKEPRGTYKSLIRPFQGKGTMSDPKEQDDAPKSLVRASKDKVKMPDDSDSDMSSLPSIVDVEPDTDSD